MNSNPPSWFSEFGYAAKYCSNELFSWNITTIYFIGVVVTGIEYNNVKELVTFSDLCDVTFVWAKLIEKVMVENIDKIKRM